TEEGIPGMQPGAHELGIDAAPGAMNENADVPRVDVTDRRRQEHEQQDERGRREHQPSHLRAETGAIATHSTASRTEAIAEGALHRYLLDRLGPGVRPAAVSSE